MSKGVRFGNGTPGRFKSSMVQIRTKYKRKFKDLFVFNVENQ